MSKNRELKVGEDIPFGPPPEYYNYRCSNCRFEEEVNEAIIDAAIGWAQFEKRYHKGWMPTLGCPVCNREAMEYVKA